ncbi:MAG: DUF1295 domain-containing protein [Pseudobacteriovorax sp.]|nr:DUF1295 domain-containing protein [Pseudobacteriovorax sp.]
MTSVYTGLAFSFVMFVVTWVASVKQKDASLIDRVWGMAFVMNAWGAAAGQGFSLVGWQWLLLLLVTIWGVRLSLHIHIRNKGHGEDYRYQDMRAGYQSGFWWKSFFTIFMVQFLLAAVVSVPLFFTLGFDHPMNIGIMVFLGTVFWILGFYFEAWGDWQLVVFKRDPSNKGKLLNKGLWSLTRHPNYFGDGAVWWGYYLFAVSVPYGWATIIGPIVMTLFLRKVSGVDLLEKKLKDSKPGYKEYVENTPAFIPWEGFKNPMKIIGAFRL